MDDGTPEGLPLNFRFSDAASRSLASFRNEEPFPRHPVFGGIMRWLSLLCFVETPPVKIFRRRLYPIGRNPARGKLNRIYFVS